MLKIALIVGSTRAQRFADTPAAWIRDAAAARKDFTLDVLDLRDEQLPFFDEPRAPIFTGGAYTNARAEAWRRKIGTYDGFIATVAEYNHGPTAVLKNALDQACFEWYRKPIAFVGYGGVGGARAIEHLRGIAIELQMAPIKHEVNIAREPMLGIMLQGKSFHDYDYLDASLQTLFDQLVWWARTLKAGREAPDAAAETVGSERVISAAVTSVSRARAS